MSLSAAACAAIVERADPDRFAAVMAAPVAARARLWPLYAFNAELARAPWASAEPMIAEMRLQWWLDAVEAAAQGRDVAHEVMDAFGPLIRDAALPTPALCTMIEARRWDIYRDPHGDDAALWAYLDATGGGLMWLACKALGATDAQEPAARNAGIALALANYLRAVPQLEAHGRTPLADPRPEAVADLARQGLGRLNAAKGARLPPAALLATWQTRPLLLLAAREPGRIREGRLALPEVIRRARLLWMAAVG